MALAISRARPDPDPGPTNKEFKRFDGPGPWWEVGSLVNPIPPDWTPILPINPAPTLPNIPPVVIPGLVGA
jgi:hypothetical protein